MSFSLPELESWRRLGVGVAVSLLIHGGLLALAMFAREVRPLVVVRKGEPLFIELPRPEEQPAPRGVPGLPPGPPTRPAAPKPPPPPKPIAKAEPPRPAPAPVKPAPAAEPVRPVPPAPKPAVEPPAAEPAPAPAPAPAPPQIAKATPDPEPAEARPAPASPKEGARSEPAAPPAGEPRMALGRPRVDLPPSLQGEGGAGRPGGGGGLRGGRGGIEGEPVPLDTTDPRYTDYFDKVRRQIKAHWIYPREAGERGIGGQLVIEFAIRKDGWLQFVDLKRSSGVSVLDQYALNALKLAQPFPPIPDAVAKGPLGIAGIFTYQIVDAGLLNQFLR